MENVKDIQSAFTEVLEILKYIPDSEFFKIPKKKIDFFKENMNQDYEYIFDAENPEFLRETGYILVSLYEMYFATKKEKEKLYDILLNIEVEKSFGQIMQYMPPFNKYNLDIKKRQNDVILDAQIYSNKIIKKK